MSWLSPRRTVRLPRHHLALTCAYTPNASPRRPQAARLRPTASPSSCQRSAGDGWSHRSCSSEAGVMVKAVVALGASAAALPLALVLLLTAVGQPSAPALA